MCSNTEKRWWGIADKVSIALFLLSLGLFAVWASETVRVALALK